MSCREEVLAMPCGHEHMLGVLSRPGDASAEQDLALVVIVGGPQYRAGSHRQFVQLARAAASAGFPTLRFDYRGMGDSEGPLRNFEHTAADIGAALAALKVALPRVQRFVLWGLCDGASAALLFLHTKAEPAVAGLVLLNPWVRSEASLAKAQVKHYYRQRLLDPAFWKKLFSGKVAAGAVLGLAGNLRRAFAGRTPATAATAPYQTRMAQAWAAFQGRVLLVLSGKDLTAREFVEYAAASDDWQRAFSATPAERLELAEADHTFSMPALQQAVERATCEWLAKV